MHKAIVWPPLVALIITTGCAAGPTDRYSRADRLTVAREEYALRKARCEEVGGAMALRVQPLQAPGLTEYRSASCVRR